MKSGKFRHQGRPWGLGLWLSTVLCLTVPGCSSAPKQASGTAAEAPSSKSVMDHLSTMKDKALESIGLKDVEVPEITLPERRLNWRIEADAKLNTLPTGEPLALLTRIYKLRSPHALMQVPAEVFTDPAQEKQRLGDDLLEVREIQLIPGQVVSFQEKTAREARYVAIVAQYRHPAAQRWRFVFSAEQAEKTGLKIGAHACALSSPALAPIGLPAGLAATPSTPCPLK